jgi:thiol-disulfide isomerase/thioredoxin
MLLEFFGTECPHCSRMHPLVERLEKEKGVKVEKYEVWHNEENAKKMMEYDKCYCGGVPFFFNTETEEYICGEAPYEKLKNWASKKK